jgi:hypothetical protein
MEQRAAERADELIAGHEVEPLPEEAQHAIRQIVEREQSWINSRR